MTDAPATFHDPARDRLLGPLLARAARALSAWLPPAAFPLLGLAAAGGALAALLTGWRIAGGLLILLAAALDVLGAGSPAGEHRLGAVVDGVADRYADAFILAGLAAWAAAHESPPAPLALGFAALAGELGLGYAVARVRASAGAGTAAALFAWAGRDVRLVVAAAGALAGLAWPALALIALVTNAAVAWALARLPGLLRR